MSLSVPALPRPFPSLLSTLNLRASAGTSSRPRHKRPPVLAPCGQPGQAGEQPGVPSGNQSGKGPPSSG